MSLINCNVELRRRLKKYCVLSVAGTDNANGNYDDNVVSNIKDTKMYLPVLTLSVRDNQNFFEKDLKDQFIGMNIKQKVKIKLRETNLDIFTNQTLLETIDCLVYFFETKMLFLKGLKLNGIYYLPKWITNNYYVIIKRKYFYGQPIDSDIIRYKKLRKLTTGHDEDYTIGCLLDSTSVKHH